jgi:AraC-like DNA-binding protein
VHIWQSRWVASTRTHHHEVKGAFGHAVLAQAAAFTFKALRVSTAIYDGNLWWPIHVEPGIKDFEAEHGKDADRGAYNSRKLAEVVRTRKLVRGEHAGFADLFQPIVTGNRAVAVLVAGPFARARPTASDLLERWRWLTGRKAHPSDPEFAAYLTTTFSTLVLEGKRAILFERLLDRFARLLAEEGRADVLTNEADVLRAELEQARAVERSWEAVRTMVDERSAQRWHGMDLVWTLGDLGMSRVPDGILVGLTAGRTPLLDPVEEAIRRDAFQRRAVDLARAIGNTLAGRVGGHGVVFVSAASGSAERRRQSLMDVAERASALARRLGLSTHFGVCVSSGSAPLDRCYELALDAAQSALAQRARVVTAASDPSRPSYSLWHLREELGHAVEEKPELSGARFDRYLEAVALHCANRMEPAQAHLEVGFERMAEVLVSAGALDAKSLGALRTALGRAAAEAHTIGDLFDAYRRAAADLAQAVQRPLPARHDRNLRAGLEHIRDHLGEPLRLKEVARVAGFSPTYFSEVFKKRQGVPFEQHVRGLRLERAKQLLAAGRLPVTRVAELSGFRSLQYFARVFRAALHVTPSEYRRKVGNPPPSKGHPETE